MKILIIDIETAPAVGTIWGLWKQNVGLSQLLASGYVLCFAAKWHGDKKVLFKSVYHDGEMEMLEGAHRLLSEADVIVSWNGQSFDIPTLNREFWLKGMAPPAPSKHVDLLRIVRKRFRFLSNKLQHIAEEKELGGKMVHSGHEMWLGCMFGDAKAWKTMAKYNKRDVILTEDLYDELQPWLGAGPNAQLYGAGPDSCPRCGGKDLSRQGYEILTSGRYQRYKCKSCRTWSRSNRREPGSGANLQGVNPS